MLKDLKTSKLVFNVLYLFGFSMLCNEIFLPFYICNRLTEHFFKSKNIMYSYTK